MFCFALIVGNSPTWKLEAWKPGEFTTVNRLSITGRIPWFLMLHEAGGVSQILLAFEPKIGEDGSHRWVGEKPPTSSGCNRSP